MLSYLLVRAESVDGFFSGPENFRRKYTQRMKNIWCLSSISIIDTKLSPQWSKCNHNTVSMTFDLCVFVTLCTMRVLFHSFVRLNKWLKNYAYDVQHLIGSIWRINVYTIKFKRVTWFNRTQLNTKIFDNLWRCFGYAMTLVARHLFAFSFLFYLFCFDFWQLMEL